jgi:hypothetical protein
VFQLHLLNGGTYLFIIIDIKTGNILLYRTFERKITGALITAQLLLDFDNWDDLTKANTLIHIPAGWGGGYPFNGKMLKQFRLGFFLFVFLYYKKKKRLINSSLLASLEQNLYLFHIKLMLILANSTIPHIKNIDRRPEFLFFYNAIKDISLMGQNGINTKPLPGFPTDNPNNK